MQFHPEVGLTENGKVVLKNFLYDIAGCSGTFTVQRRELECIREIQEQAGTSKVLVSPGLRPPWARAGCAGGVVGSGCVWRRCC